MAAADALAVEEVVGRHLQMGMVTAVAGVAWWVAYEAAVLQWQPRRRPHLVHMLLECARIDHNVSSNGAVSDHTARTALLPPESCRCQGGHR